MAFLWAEKHVIMWVFGYFGFIAGIAFCAIGLAIVFYLCWVIDRRDAVADQKKQRLIEFLDQ